MTKLPATLTTALVILAEWNGTSSSRVCADRQEDERYIREAYATAKQLETVARGLRRREEDRLSFPLDPSRQQAYSRADAKASEKAAALLKPWGIGASIGGDCRGSLLHLLTPKTGRYNTMGGAEAGWAI